MRAPWFLVTLALLVGCGGELIDDGLGDDPGPGSTSDAGPTGKKTEAGSTPDPQNDPKACGGQSIPIQMVQKGDVPDLFLVVDRSGSMISPVDFFNFFSGTKWDVMRKTLISLVETYKGNIRFGLSVFPSDNSCAAGKIDVPLQMGNDPTIKSKLNQTSANGNTPTHTTLAAVHGYVKSVPAVKGGRYVLLATDGMPNCGGQPDDDSGTQTLSEVQKLLGSGVKTFVLGFGSIAAGNPTLLNQLASAGGVPNTTGSSKFYPANNEQELKTALFKIAGGIIPPPCTYKLNSKPPDPEKVTVTFDGQSVPRTKSNKDGWNYTSNGSEITFFGSYCTKLRLGQVKTVKVLYGCKGPVVD